MKMNSGLIECPPTPPLSSEFDNKSKIDPTCFQIDGDQNETNQASPFCSLNAPSQKVKKMNKFNEKLQMNVSKKIHKENLSDIDNDEHDEDLSEVNKKSQNKKSQHKRRRRKKPTVIFWTLTTMTSPNFDPKRLTARQQTTLIKKKAELGVAANETDEQMTKLLSPFIMDKLDDIYDWTNSKSGKDKKIEDHSHSHSHPPLPLPNEELFYDNPKKPLKKPSKQPSSKKEPIQPKKTKSPPSCPSNSASSPPKRHSKTPSSPEHHGSDPSSPKHHGNDPTLPVHNNVITLPFPVLDTIPEEEDKMSSIEDTAPSQYYHTTIVTPSTMISYRPLHKKSLAISHLIELKRWLSYFLSFLQHQSHTCKFCNQLEAYFTAHSLSDYGVQVDAWKKYLSCCECFHSNAYLSMLNDLLSRQSKESECLFIS